MRKDQIHNSDSLLGYRRELRKGQTPEEKLLWSYLRNRRLGRLKFTRQHSIDGYIVDFYCAEKKLVIELDGIQHFTADGKLSDFERDAHLRSLGYNTLRFPNTQIQDDLFTVLDIIRKSIH